MDGEGKTTWTSAYFAHFLLEEFEGEYIALNPLSGETHVLNEYARQILELIAQDPFTVADLAARMSDFRNAEADTQTLSDHLAQLEDWGLVWRVG